MCKLTIFLYFSFNFAVYGLNTTCCIPLSQNSVYLKYPISERVISHLRKYYCGYYDQPYVYCLDDNELADIAQDACITPNGKPGTCTPLGKCTNIYNNTVTQAAISFDFTHDSLCGHYKEPIVCCGTDGEYSKEFAANLPDPDSCGKWTTEKYPPWMVKIDTNDSHCLGSLINKNYVLTKASCVINRRNVRVHILLCNPGSTCIYSVKQTKIFPVYRIPYSTSNDVALLKLDKDVKGVMPACLYEEPLEVNVEVTVSLLTTFKSGYVVYNHTELTMFQDECSRKNTHITDRQFCTVMDKKDCYKHSLKGAPVQLLDEDNNRWYLVGVSKHCVFEPPTKTLVSERVFEYIKWIKSNIS